MTYGSTAGDDEFIYQGKCIHRCPRAVGYKVLGTIITFNNRHDLELDRRIRAAWCAFHKHKLVLRSKSCALSKRIASLAVVAVAAAVAVWLWLAAAVAVCLRLRTTSMRVIRMTQYLQ